MPPTATTCSLSVWFSFPCLHSFLYPFVYHFNRWQQLTSILTRKSRSVISLPDTHTHRRWHGNRLFYCFTFLYRTDHQRQEKPAFFSSLSPLNSKSDKKRRQRSRTNDEYSLKRRFLYLTAFEYQSNTSMFRLSYSTRACWVIWDIDRSSSQEISLHDHSWLSKERFSGCQWSYTWIRFLLFSSSSSSGKPRRAKPHDYCLVTLNQI